MQDTGLHTRREVPIPEFTRLVAGQNGAELRDGILDLMGWCPSWGECLLDVTIRHPFAQRYQPAAAHASGHANACGEHDKLQTYPDSAGRRVTPCSLETFGRFGPQFDHFLVRLVSFARDRERLRGLSSTRHLPKWRLQLGTALMKCIAKTIIDSLLPSRARSSPPSSSSPCALHAASALLPAA